MKANGPNMKLSFKREINGGLVNGGLGYFKNRLFYTDLHDKLMGIKNYMDTHPTYKVKNATIIVSYISPLGGEHGRRKYIYIGKSNFSRWSILLKLVFIRSQCRKNNIQIDDIDLIFVKMSILNCNHYYYCMSSKLSRLEVFQIITKDLFDNYISEKWGLNIFKSK